MVLDPFRIIGETLPTEFTGPLRVDRYIGEGKAGCVYKASGPDGKRALKFYKEWVEKKPESADRIQREAAVPPKSVTVQ